MNRPFGTFSGRPSFEEARAMYVNRYTAEHVPGWAAADPQNGKFYAPHFRSDREWYDNTLFPGEDEHLSLGWRDSCLTTGQTWPYGHWLDEPFRKDDPPPRTKPAGPRVGVTFDMNGHGEGREFSSVGTAAREIASWVADLDAGNTGDEISITIEIQHPEED